MVSTANPIGKVDGGRCGIDQDTNNITFYFYPKQVNKSHKSMKNLRMYENT